MGALSAWAALLLAVVLVEPPPASSPPTKLVALGGGHPGPLVVSESGVWATVYGGRGHSRVVRIDPTTHAVTARVPVRGSPFHIAAGARAVWVTGNDMRSGDVLQRIDPRAERVAATISVPGRYAGPIAVGERSVWVLASNHEVTRQWLVRIDAASNEIVRSVPLGPVRPRYIQDLDIRRGFVWLLAVRVGRNRNLPGDVLRFDPRTSRVTAKIDAAALGMEAGPGGMWINGCFECSSRRRRTDYAQRVDLPTNRLAGPRIAVRGVSFGPVFAGRDRVWFGGYDRSERTIAFSIDPESGQIERFLRVSPFLHSGMALDPGGQALWVARAPGGLLRVDLTGG
jgi:hypothetical protein